MRREANIAAGILAAAAAVVGIYLLVPVVSRALADDDADDTPVALVPQNARALRLNARLEKKARKRLAHAEPV